MDIKTQILSNLINDTKYFISLHNRLLFKKVTINKLKSENKKLKSEKLVYQLVIVWLVAGLLILIVEKFN